MLSGMFVVAFELGTRHVDLATHFEHGGPVVAAQAQRYGLDRAQVDRHILAGFAIATRRALHKHAVLVTQADGEAIELGFEREHRICDVETFFDATDEIFDLFVAEGVGQGEHAQFVAHLGEFARRGCANASGRRIRCRQFGMRRLNGFKLTHQLVVIGIRNLRVIKDVVAVVCFLDALAEFGDAGDRVGGFCRRGHWGVWIKSWPGRFGSPRATCSIGIPYFHHPGGSRDPFAR